MEVVRLSTGYLESHGSASPRLDAEVLAALALNLRRLDLYLQFDRPLEAEQLDAIRDLVRRRGDGEPVAHITGRREFYGRSFSVSPQVLIPRPDTETLVQLALAEARRRAPGGEGLRIADIATGSGCIAVTLAVELPGAEVVATDLSEAALEVARDNAQAHGVTGRVEILSGSWCEPLAGRRFDIVVSNPPYVTTVEMAGLAADVRDHEPRLALDGGTDGLCAYRSLMPSMAALLEPGGWAALEVDVLRAADVATIVTEALGPSTRTQKHADLTGRTRVLSLVVGTGRE